MTDEQNIETPVESQETGNAEASSPEAEEMPVENAGAEENPAVEETPADQAGSSEGSEAPNAETPADDSKVVNESDASEEDAEAAMMAMLEDLPAEEKSTSPDDIDFGSTAVSKAEFQHLSSPAGSPEPRNIDILMDVNLPVSIELGRTKMSIADILGLGPGSVVELNKLAGEPVDVLVNYKIVAKGEVVVVDENFGVRITQLMTPEERLKLLSEDH